MRCEYAGDDKYGCPNCLGECGVMKKDKDPGAMKVWTLNLYGEALFGPRFQRELAAALNVNERTMRRWVAGDTAPPDSIRAELDALARRRIKALETLLKA